MRTIPNISSKLKCLDAELDSFVSAILDDYKFSSANRKLFSLPVKLGGLAIPIFSEISDTEYENSRKVTKDLTQEVKDQKIISEIDCNKLKKVKQEVKRLKNEKNKAAHESLIQQLQKDDLKVHEAITEAGASNWLTTIPLKNQGFYLDKRTFWDALCLRYNTGLRRMPEKCVCGNHYNIKDALSCTKGGFIAMRHNAVRDLTAELLNVVCNDVNIEPSLRPLTGECFAYRVANTDDGARTDVSARGFWTRGQKAFVDIRIFNPIANQYSNQNLKAAHRQNEREKKRTYNERINQVEHASFTQLVFSCYGGMSHECEHFYKWLGAKIADKRDDQYNTVVNFIRTKLSFSLVKSMITCIRGSRSIKQNIQPISEIDISNEFRKFNLAE